MVWVVKKVNLRKEAQDSSDKLSEKGRSEVTYEMPGRSIWLCPSCGAETEYLTEG